MLAQAHPEEALSIEQICSSADNELFASVNHNPDHVMSDFLPMRKESVHAQSARQSYQRGRRQDA